MVDGRESTRRGVLWSIVGVLATLVLGGPALYFTLQERTPSLKYEITSEANVFDLHKSLENLDIIFQGENIRQAKQNLRIITLTLRNDGRTTILQNHFDMTGDWGFNVENAELVDVPRIVDSNSDYLREKLQPIVTTTNTVVFQKVIFERGKYIALELLLLHSADTPPTLRPVGKIAGIDRLVVERRPAEQVVSTFWGSVLQGSFWVHLSRVGLYVVIILAGILIIAGLTKIATARKARRRRLRLADRERRFEQHFKELFSEMPPADKPLAIALLRATGGRADALKELRDAVTSEETVRKLEEGERMLEALSASEAGNMFSFDVRVPEAIFEKQENNEYVVSERAARVVPALADFVVMHPIPDGIAEAGPIRYPFYGHMRFGAIYEHLAEEKEEGIDWDAIHWAINSAQQRHRRLQSKPRTGA